MKVQQTENHELHDDELMFFVSAAFVVVMNCCNDDACVLKLRLMKNNFQRFTKFFVFFFTFSYIANEKVIASEESHSEEAI